MTKPLKVKHGAIKWKKENTEMGLQYLLNAGGRLKSEVLCFHYGCSHLCSQLFSVKAFSLTLSSSSTPLIILCLHGLPPPPLFTLFFPSCTTIFFLFSKLSNWPSVTLQFAQIFLSSDVYLSKTPSTSCSPHCEMLERNEWGLILFLSFNVLKRAKYLLCFTTFLIFKDKKILITLRRPWLY